MLRKIKKKEGDMLKSRILLLSIAIGLVCSSLAIADRYDNLINSWNTTYANRDIGGGTATSTDAMVLAWNCMNEFHPAYYAYQLTKNTLLVDKMYAALNNNILNATRRNTKNQVGYVYPDNTEEAGETFRIVEGVLMWVYIIKSTPSLQAQYGAYADRCLKKMEDTIVARWINENLINDAKDPDMATTDFHYPGSSMMMLDSIVGGASNRMSSPNNKNSSVGYAMYFLYLITHKQQYLDIVTQIALRFKSVMMWQNGGQYYSWHYFDPFWRNDFTSGHLGGAQRLNTWIEHRSGYGDIDLTLATECYRMGIVFNKADIQRYVRTNRDIMYNPGGPAGGWKMNDGSIPDTNYDNHGGLYYELCPYDSTSTLANIGYNSFANIGDYGSQCNVPYYAYIMKLTGNALTPPDTLHPTGPLEVINLEPLNRTTIRLTFANPVDSVSAKVAANYAFTRGVSVVGISINQADKRIVTLTTTPHDTITHLYKLTIKHVKDIYNNQPFNYIWSNHPYSYNSSIVTGIADPHMQLTNAAFLELTPNPGFDRIAVKYAADFNEGPAMVRIYNSAGKQVFSAAVPNQIAGANQLVWDRMGSNGQRVKAGVYLVELVKQHQRVTRKLMLAE
jgi:hypothetical protein